MASVRRPSHAYGLSLPLPPLLPPNSDSDELTLGAAGAGAGAATGAGAGAAAAGRGAGLGLATFGAALFLEADFFAAFFFADFFFADFFLAAFFFGAALRRADFFDALRATFLRVIFDLALTRAFLDFAAFFFPRFLDAFLAAIGSPLPLDRCVFV